jgi:hypothetical protein
MAKTPPEKSDHYRAQAEKMRAVADGCHQPDLKEQLLDLARQYDDLVERALAGQ